MLSFTSLAVRTRPIATPPKREEPSKELTEGPTKELTMEASKEPTAQEPANPPPSSEANPIQLTIRNHPAVRPASTATDKTVGAAKSKAKKHASAAPMLKSKAKVLKTRSQAKVGRKVMVPAAQRALVHQVNVGVDEARLAIMAKEDAAFNNVYDTFMASLEDFASDDSAFVQSIDDTLALIWAPLELERVETTNARDFRSHITRSIAMSDRIKTLKELIKKNEAEIADYWRQWEEMQDDFLQFGVDVFGKNAFACAEDAVAAMRHSFDQKMGALNADHDRLVGDLEQEMRIAGDEAVTNLCVVEQEFESAIRNAKSMVFRFLL